MIYTSGTTGPPKGVMLSHYNVVWTAEGYLRMLDVEPVGFRAVSYLPMAHIAERMSTHYLAVIGGYEVTTCPDPGQIAAYAREVHPQIMFGVPRVWEKIYAGVQAALGADPDKKQKFDEAVAAAIPIIERRTLGTATDEDNATWEFLDSVAFANVRALVGLDAVEYAITGAAPIPAELISWYRAIGVPLSEIYGMSESTGPMTWEPTRVKAGTVGRAVPRHRLLPRRRRRGVHPRRQRVPGLPRRPREDGRGARRRRHAALRRHRRVRRRGLPADHRPQEGAHHHRRRQEHQPRQPRGRAEDDPAGRPKRSPSATSGRSCPPCVVLDGEVAPVWAKDHGIEFDTLADLAANPDVIAEVERGLERGDGRASTTPSASRR